MGRATRRSHGPIVGALALVLGPLLIVLLTASGVPAATPSRHPSPVRADDVEPVPYQRGGEAHAGGPDTVAVICDSITRDSSVWIEQALAGPWWVNVRGVAGSMFPDHEDWFASVAASAPRAVVVNLGTNDLLCHVGNTVGPPFCRDPYYVLADTEAIVRGFAADLGPDVCVVGVTLWMWSPGQNDVNDLWERLQTEGAIDGLADWESVVASDAARYVRDWAGHPTPAGQGALAQLIRQRVDTVCTLEAPVDLRAHGGDGHGCSTGSRPSTMAAPRSRPTGSTGTGRSCTRLTVRSPSSSIPTW